MIWTYDLNTTVGKVRLQIGDTDPKTPLLYDEEITVVAADRTDVLSIAADCCDVLVAKFSRDVDRSNLGMNASRSQKVTHYTDLGTKLRARASSYAEVTLTGTSDAEVTASKADADYRDSYFTRDRDRNAG